MDPLHPPLSLLVKLGSALVHADEFMSPGGHKFDKAALDTVANDVEVEEWLKAMDSMGFLPKRRS